MVVEGCNGVDGCMWLCMVVYGCPWLWMVMYGCGWLQWLSVVVNVLTVLEGARFISPTSGG